MKVGDRVRGVGVVDGLKVDGQCGTIIDSGIFYMVEFDKKFDSELHGKHGRCWNLANGEMILIKNDDNWEKHKDDDPFGEDTW